MVRRVSTFTILLICCCLLLSFSIDIAHGKGSPADIGVVCDGTTATFSAGITTVIICPAIVETGHVLRISIHSRRFAPVHLVMQLPDGSMAFKNGYTDQGGTALLALPIRYVPLNRYAQAQFQVVVGKVGSPAAETVSGTVTIAQIAPLSHATLRLRVLGAGACAADCTVQNGATLVIRVDTDAGAQVVVTLTYPDGQATSCTSNDLTGTPFADSAGVYRCEQPVAFQGQASQRGSCLLLTAAISSGGATKTLPRRLCLASG